MLTRRRFISISALAGVGVLAGCSRDDEGRSGAPVSTTAQRSGRRADVIAKYTAAPMTVAVAGRELSTWGYDSLLPGRELRARAGDLVEVTYSNNLPEATSVHWHGLAIVNSMDGVPGVTQPDIEPGGSFTYRFEVPDPGTYWFHPHHGLQLERGLYAPLIVDDPDEHVAVDSEYTLVLDDWLDGTGTSPSAEFERIRQVGASMGDTGDMSGMSHDMGGMSMATSPLLGGDAGDAVYPYHLVNGRPASDPATLDPRPQPGDRVRLRFINASGDTAYRVAVGGHRLTVTHADGFPVDPIEVDAFLIGMGERYDVVITVQSGAWPIVALAEGKDDRGGAIIRTNDVQPSEVTFEAAELEGRWLRYADLAAHPKARLDPPAEVTAIDLRLTGDMMRSNWAFNDLAFADLDPIEVVAGQWYSLNIENATTMWHPIHLHGHTPQLGDAAGGVRKDTVNVLPGDTVKMVFQASNPGKWMLHCHNAYHLESGMAALVTYRSES